MRLDLHAMHVYSRFNGPGPVREKHWLHVPQQAKLVLDLKLVVAESA
jgi:hypothetical protein